MRKYTSIILPDLHNDAIVDTDMKKSVSQSCLTAAKDGIKKFKPMIEFKGANRKSILLNQEFKGRFFIASSANGWMTLPLTS